MGGKGKMIAFEPGAWLGVLQQQAASAATRK